MGWATTTFGGFTTQHLDAFEQRKWASNRFNLERMRAADALEAGVRPALDEESRSRLGLDFFATPTHPCIFNRHQVDSIWAGYGRNEEARRKLAAFIGREHPLRRQIEDPAEHHLHAFVGATLHWGGLAAGLWVHRNAWLDARNSAARMADPVAGPHLVEALVALAPAEVAFLPHLPRPAAEVDAEWLTQGLADLVPEGEEEWFFAGRTWGRGDAALSAPSIADEVAAVLRAVLPVYALMAWRPDNDFLDAAAKLERRRHRRRKAAATPAGGGGPVEPGRLVRITSGLFAGHRGRVLELDGRGGARVLVGAVTVHADVAQLKPT